MIPPGPCAARVIGAAEAEARVAPLAARAPPV